MIQTIWLSVFIDLSWFHGFLYFRVFAIGTNIKHNTTQTKTERLEKSSVPACWVSSIGGWWFPGHAPGPECWYVWWHSGWDPDPLHWHVLTWAGGCPPAPSLRPGNERWLLSVYLFMNKWEPFCRSPPPCWKCLFSELRFCWINEAIRYKKNPSKGFCSMAMLKTISASRWAPVFYEYCKIIFSAKCNKHTKFLETLSKSYWVTSMFETDFDLIWSLPKFKLCFAFFKSWSINWFTPKICGKIHSNLCRTIFIFVLTYVGNKQTNMQHNRVLQPTMLMEVNNNEWNNYAKKHKDLKHFSRR